MLALIPYGLSPLARGTVCRICGVYADQRFIPARAGNSLPRYTRGGRIAVYPRSRGEQKTYGFGKKMDRGLSPLARGTE